VARPELTMPAKFPKKLHKKKTYTDPVLIYGKNIAVKDEVNVNGTRGKKPTNWSGKVTKANGDGTYDAEVTVDHEEENNDVRKDDKVGGTEDVSVTVSNAMSTSDPVTTPKVDTIP